MATKASAGARGQKAGEPVGAPPGGQQTPAGAFNDDELTIEYRDTASLVPYAKNARVHSDAQVAQIAASIREFGFRNPVLIDEHGGLIAGHGRVLAAKVLDMPELPCIVVRGLSDAQRRAFVLADNKIATNASWNADLLRVELSELRFATFDIAVIGFNDAELGQLFDDGTRGGDANAEWDGMPEFDQPDAGAFRSIICHFQDQAAVEEFAKLTGRKLTNRYLWFPEMEIDSVAETRYVAKDA